MTSLRIPSILPIATIALLTALLPLVGCDGAATFRATRTTQIAHVAGMPVKVATDNGSVEVIRGQAADVEITAHIKAQTQERLDATTVAVVREASGQLSVSVDWPQSHRKSNEGCSFEIKIPDAVGVTIETSNGHIKLDGLGGLADLETSNGTINVTRHDGEVRAHTSNGHVEIDDITGKADARTSNGSITLSQIQGSAEADTSNGSIDIRLSPTSTGPIFADSSNGSLKVEVGPAFNGVIEMRTSNGGISVDGAEATGGKGNKKVTVGSGGRDSTLSTSNGRIHVVVKR